MRRPAFVAGLADHGERPALLGPQPVSYRELARRVRGRADELGAGRRLVLIAAASTAQVLVSYLAALDAGHAVLLVPGEDAGRVNGWVARYDPDLVVHPDGTLQARRDGSAHDLHPELALLMTTSGSTGSPKLVRLSYDNLDSNAEAIATALHLTADDRAVTTLPLAYCYGLSVVHTHLLRGAGVLLSTGSVSDAGFGDLLRRHDITTLAGVPYTFALLDRTGLLTQDLPALRRVTQAGGRLAPDQVRRLARTGRAAGWEFVVMYGQTEATARMAVLPPELTEQHPGSVGRAVAGGSLRIDRPDETGVGELVYDGPNVMLGYAERAADLALGRTVQSLRTGDLARCSPAGLIEIVGRSGRRAKIFGLRIDLDQVERNLQRAGVTCWCAAGDDRLEVLVQQDGAPPGPHLAARIAAAAGLPARAVHAVLVPELPRAGSGKVDGAAAHRLLSASPPGDQGAAPGRVAALYTDVLGRADVHADSTFAALGGDSLTYVEVSLALEDLLGELPADWPELTVAALERRRAAAGAAAGRRAAGRLDSSVLLRAVAITLVVSSHAHLLALVGGAHALLAVAGFNLARFGLRVPTRSGRVRNLLRSTARLALVSTSVIAGAALVTPGVGPVPALLLTSVLGPDVLGPPWRYWFVEALVWALLALAALLAVPAVDRWERRAPFGLAAGVLAAAVLLRQGVQVLGSGPDRTQSAAAVLWLVALGWCAARAGSRAQRIAVTLAAAALVPGFFDRPTQPWLVLAAVTLLVWWPQVRWPRRLDAARAPLATVAGASLTIYLTHWQVVDLLRGTPAGPVVTALACLAVGVLVHRLVTTTLRRTRGRWRGRLQA